MQLYRIRHHVDYLGSSREPRCPLRSRREGTEDAIQCHAPLSEYELLAQIYG